MMNGALRGVLSSNPLGKAQVGSTAIGSVHIFLNIKPIIHHHLETKEFTCNYSRWKNSNFWKFSASPPSNAHSQRRSKPELIPGNTSEHDSRLERRWARKTNF